MFGFEEVSQVGGVDLLAQPNPFMAVPLRGSSLVFRDVTKGSQLPTGNRFVEVKDITDLPVARIAMEIAQGDMIGALFALIGILPRGSTKRLLMISGKTPGVSTLKAGLDTIDVAVLRPKTVTLSFKFVHFGQGKSATGTTWNPADADGMIAAMNNIYAQQANVTCKLHKADLLQIDGSFGDVIDDKVYDEHLKEKYDKDADVTVLLVGKWTHTRTRTANATTIPYGKNRVIVINDKPTGEGVEGIDPFQLTLAHELAHSLGADHGGTDGQGHQKRNHVLLSDGQQSLKISKDVLLMINPWEGAATGSARH
jgi:hypothetical protein